MGANECALVTLDTGINLPFGNVDCDTAFFISASAAGEGTVSIFVECAYGEFVAFQTVHGNEQIVYKFVAGCRSQLAIFCICPSSGNFYCNDGVDALVNSSVVHVNNVLTFFAVGVFNSFFQMFNCGFQRNNVSQFEESRLHNHIDATAQTNFLSNFHSINDVEFNIVLSDVAFQLTGQICVQFFCGPGAVKQEGAAFFQTCGYVIVVNVGLVVNCNEVCCVNQVRSHNGHSTETQVGNGYAARFFRVVREVALSVHIGVVADDFDCALVCANGTVTAQTPEFASFGAFFSNVDVCANGQGGVGNIISDANGKVVFRFSACQVVEYCNNVSRNQIFGA